GKCGRLLANALRDTKQSTFISKIKTPSGDTSHKLPDILKAFQEFYADLYNIRKTPPSRLELEQYLAPRIKQTVPNNLLQHLEEPIHIDEFLQI
ncbi:Hypothetical predicted protein, partial [Pelobates cultripes]